MENRRPMGDGSGFPLARGPSEPSHKSTSTQPARLDPVAVLCAGQNVELLDARRRLHRAMAWTASKAVRCQSGFARDLCWLANEAAGHWVFARADAETLNDIADSLLKLLMIADLFERVGDGV